MKDIVIVGGGPAGLHAAYRLASAGLEVAVFDAQTQIGERAICSGVVGLEAFSQFGLPTGSVLNTIRRIQAVSPAGRKLHYTAPDPLAHVVNKGKFNHDLANRAAAAGAELWLGNFVESCDRQKHGLAVHYRPRGSGHRETLKARAAIIASGVNQSLTGNLGLARPREFLRAAQADIPLGKDGAARSTKLYVGRSIAPGAFGWRIPLGHGRVRVGVMTEEEPRPYFKKLLTKIAPDLQPNQCRIHQKAIAQLSRGKCAADHILVIGEAAGHVKTTTGGGIYYGLFSAELAAGVMLRAFEQNDLTERTLSEFDRSWRSLFGRELRTGFYFRKLLAWFPDSLLEKTFEKAAEIDLLGGMNGNLKFDWHHKAILIAIQHLIDPASRF